MFFFAGEQTLCIQIIQQYNENRLWRALIKSRKAKLKSTLKEGTLTFFVGAKELQLFLLLPPQCVDDGDGQPERFFGVSVWSQGIHSGTRCRDVLCGKEKLFHLYSFCFFFLHLFLVISNHNSSLSPCHKGHPRVSKRDESRFSW